MARSDSVTLLPLDRYSQLMQIPLTHFNQLQGAKAPVVKNCNNKGVWDQDARNALAWTIATAEELIAEFLIKSILFIVTN